MGYSGAAGDSAKEFPWKHIAWKLRNNEDPGQGERDVLEEEHGELSAGEFKKVPGVCDG